MKKEFNYITLVGLHILLGFVLYTIPVFRKPIFLAIIVYFFIRIISAHNSKKTFEVLLACAYIIGGEAMFRMTSGGLFYEISKYLIILFVLLGMFYKGISGKGYPYFFYLIALVPAVVVASINLNFDLNFRTSVAFVLSGPVSLGITALFCYDKKISQKQILDIILYMSLPIISMTTYLFFYTPSLKSILSGTESNFATSGGFGPNQVASILGLGIFALTVRFFLKSPSLFLKIVNGILLAAITYRGIITFSRGGVFTAIITIGAFLLLIYAKSSYRQKQQIIATFSLFCILGIATWLISSNQTSGLIDKRYANEDALGRSKNDITTGRGDIFLGEMEGFVDNPFFGVGASGMKNLRLETEGTIIASHNEISRLFSEHGMLGIFILMILLMKPIAYRASNKRNIFFYSFLAFWFATINHSAMRLAAPGFIYALALLNIVNEKRLIHRKQPAK